MNIVGDEFSTFQDLVITCIMVAFGVSLFLAKIIFFTTKFNKDFLFAPWLIAVTFFGILILEYFVF